jgi:outer membrane protein OmpA-like peptidoglycan-associated protein
VVSAAPPPARAIITQAPAARETIKEPATEATPEKTTAELSKPLAQPVLQAAPAISPDTVLFQLKYSQSQTAASDSERDAMLAALAPYLYDRSKRIRVVSYAAPDDAQGNKSRRLSLQRAIQVRSLLMNAGFESLRVHVQAMGDKTSGSGPADRVDLFIISE